MPAIKMFMGPRRNFENLVRKDGIEKVSVYLNKDTGELYYVYEDNEPILNSIDIDIPDTYPGSPLDWEDTYKPLEY